MQMDSFSKFAQTDKPDSKDISKLDLNDSSQRTQKKQR